VLGIRPLSTAMAGTLPPGNPDNFTFTARDVLDTASFSFERPPPQKPNAAASVRDVGRPETGDVG
jgi:hypothetical protein